MRLTVSLEEEDVTVDLKSAKKIVFEEGRKYAAVFDSLSGSSNVDAGIPTAESVLVVHYSSNAISDCMHTFGSDHAAPFGRMPPCCMIMMMMSLTRFLISL